jgi:hypothetical protein
MTGNKSPQLRTGSFCHENKIALPPKKKRKKRLRSEIDDEDPDMRYHLGGGYLDVILKKIKNI